MTRTARASFPRAILKDRSESKSGHRDDKHVRKDGAGAHGWGSIADEKAHEEAGLRDEQLEFYEELDHEEYSKPAFAEVVKLDALEKTASSSSTSEKDLENARQFRKNALKGQGIDLAAIARTSMAVSTSPTSPTLMRPVTVTNGADTSVLTAV